MLIYLFLYLLFVRVIISRLLLILSTLCLQPNLNPISTTSTSFFHVQVEVQAIDDSLPFISQTFPCFFSLFHVFPLCSLSFHQFSSRFPTAFSPSTSPSPSSSSSAAKSSPLQRQSTSKLITFELKLRFKFCYVLLGLLLFDFGFLFSAIFCGHSYLVSNDSN